MKVKQVQSYYDNSHLCQIWHYFIFEASKEVRMPPQRTKGALLTKGSLMLMGK